MSFSHSIGVCDTTRSICLWLQTSCSSGATLRSPTRIERSDGAGLQHRVIAHLVEEGELVGEFRIDRRIGNVAAGGNIEIVHRDRIAQSGALAEHRGNMPAVGLAAEALDVEALERQPREHDDAVIALLAVERDVLVAEPLEALERKVVVRALRLLQAENVRTNRLDEFGDQIDAQPHRIDVPGRELKCRHRHRVSGIRDREIK